MTVCTRLCDVMYQVLLLFKGTNVMNGTTGGIGRQGDVHVEQTHLKDAFHGLFKGFRLFMLLPTHYSYLLSQPPWCTFGLL